VERGEEKIVVPCGFKSNGKLRKVRSTCLLARMKNLCLIKKETPKLAICITMYNEDESQLKTTLRGILQNYNVLYQDPRVNMRQNDMVVVCVCDGFDKIPESFKKYATEKKFLDIELLKQKGFME